MKLWPVAAVLLLSGCAMFDGPVPLYDEVNIRVLLVDSIPGAYPGQVGRATWMGPFCDVLLLRSHYPRCLQHEARHCFEGPFHGANSSSEDCFY